MGVKLVVRCDHCGRETVLPAAPADPPPVPPRRAAGPVRPRTVREVVAARAAGGGCCGRYADNLGCGCLADAAAADLRAAGVGWLAAYDLTHDNGCGVCRDPLCDNPNGQH